MNNIEIIEQHNNRLLAFYTNLPVQVFCDGQYSGKVSPVSIFSMYFGLHQSVNNRFIYQFFLVQADKYRTRMKPPFIHPEDVFICFQHIPAQIPGFWGLLKVTFLKWYREDFTFFQELFFGGISKS